MKTRILSGLEARLALQRGVNVMADVVGSSLTPLGRNSAIAYTTPQGVNYEDKVIHDGVKIADSIELPDEFEYMGAKLVRHAARKQVGEVGDGTTVVMILAQAIINEYMALINTGVNPMPLRRKLEQSVDLLVTELEKLATPIKGLEDMEFVATISAQDRELGSLIAETLNKVGKDGIVTVEESKSPDSSVEIQEGMQFDKGFLHPWFATNPARGEAFYENAYFLITDKSITSLSELSKFLSSFIKQSKTLIIIAPEVSGEALPLLIQNKLEGKLFTLCIQAPSFGQDQKNILQDIAVLTGGKLISEDAGHKFEDITIYDLGFAESILSTHEETIIAGGRGAKKDVDERIQTIKLSLEETESDFDRERLKSRLGKLTDGVAVIRVGGQTEIEMKERRERVLDSVAATRAAMDKGIVAGGEVVYLHVRRLLDRGTHADRILYDALYKPFLKLLENAALDEVEIAKLLDRKSKNFGVDVMDGEVKDLFKAGIVDPVLVSIHALKNALSVAVQICTTENIIVPDYEYYKNLSGFKVL